MYIYFNFNGNLSVDGDVRVVDKNSSFMSKETVEILNSVGKGTTLIYCSSVEHCPLHCIAYKSERHVSDHVGRRSLIGEIFEGELFLTFPIPILNER